jgi:septal ring factor EnvC (AmiA/AmiB activator)
MDLMHELLKQMQGSLARLEQGQHEIRADIRGVKMQINDMQRTIINVESDIAELQLDVGRIKKRLDLVEA